MVKKKMTIRQAFQKGLKALRSGKFTLTNGKWFEIVEKKSCGCACGLIVFGAGFRTKNDHPMVYMERFRDVMKALGCSPSEQMQISSVYESAKGRTMEQRTEAGLKAVDVLLVGRSREKARTA